MTGIHKLLIRSLLSLFDVSATKYRNTQSKTIKRINKSDVVTSPWFCNIEHETDLSRLLIN